MPKFEVGEIAIIQSPTIPGCNGMETEIISPFMFGGVQAYQCTVQNNEGGMYETSLKKLPPKDTPSTWEEMEKLTGFKPKVLEEA